MPGRVSALARCTKKVQVAAFKVAASKATTAHVTAFPTKAPHARAGTEKPRLVVKPPGAAKTQIGDPLRQKSSEHP